MRLGVIQHRGDAGLDSVVAATQSLLQQGAELVALPELFALPYFPQSQEPRFFDLAEAADGVTFQRCAGLAREYRAWIIAPIFERRDNLFYNTALCIGPDGLASRYRKLHIPEDPGFHEKYYFTPGDLPIEAVAINGLRVATMICWDQWFPETARLAALAGADLLIYPSAIGSLDAESPAERARQRDAWVTVHRAHAICNHCFVLALNRTGHEAAPAGATHGSGIDFWGNSLLCAPDGTISWQSGIEPVATVLDLDFRAAETLRRDWPFFRDRRPDVYTGLCTRALKP